MAGLTSLSHKSVSILSMMANGYSYQQIVDGLDDVTYLDIFQAAVEALELNGTPTANQARLAVVKSRHPRAYQRWTHAEDEKLAALHEQGKHVRDISVHLERQPSAVHSRLVKLGLVEELDDDESFPEDHS